MRNGLVANPRNGLRVAYVRDAGLHALSLHGPYVVRDGSSDALHWRCTLPECRSGIAEVNE